MCSSVSFLHFFINLGKDVNQPIWENFVFFVIFDTCDVVYNLSISPLPPIVLDNLFVPTQFILLGDFLSIISIDLPLKGWNVSFKIKRYRRFYILPRAQFNNFLNCLCSVNPQDIFTKKLKLKIIKKKYGY